MALKKIGILGSGTVGQQLGFGLVHSGYDAKIGTRTPSKLADWVKLAGRGASVGSVKDAAAFGDIIVLCTKGTEAENVILNAGKNNFTNKVVIDVTNPLVFEKEGQPPRLGVGYPASNGMKIQKLLPNAKVVKAFNTVPATYMTNPKLKEGSLDLFIAGNDPSAKKAVSDIASKWGWSVIDIGSIEQAYLLEALAMLWIVYGFMNNYWSHAFKLLKK